MHIISVSFIFSFFSTSGPLTDEVILQNKIYKCKQTINKKFLSLVISKSNINLLSKQWSHNQWILSAHWLIVTNMEFILKLSLSKFVLHFGRMQWHRSNLILPLFGLFLRCYSIKSLFFGLLFHSTAFKTLQLDSRSTFKYLESGK